MLDFFARRIDIAIHVGHHIAGMALSGEEIIKIIEAAKSAGLASFKSGELELTWLSPPPATAGGVATNPRNIASTTEAVPNDEVDEIDSQMVKDQELAELLITSPEAYEEAILRLGREDTALVEGLSV